MVGDTSTKLVICNTVPSAKVEEELATFTMVAEIAVEAGINEVTSTMTPFDVTEEMEGV